MQLLGPRPMILTHMAIQVRDAKIQVLPVQLVALCHVICGSRLSVECSLSSCSLVLHARLPVALLAAIVFSLDTQVRVYELI